MDLIKNIELNVLNVEKNKNKMVLQVLLKKVKFLKFKEKEMKNNEVESLKDNFDYERIRKDSEREGCVFSQHSSSFQIYAKDDKSDDYYLESTNERRGAMPEFNKGSHYYHIATVLPKNPNLENYNNCFNAILFEKIKNDIRAIQDIILKLKEDGKIEKTFSYTVDYLIDFLKERKDDDK